MSQRVEQTVSINSSNTKSCPPHPMAGDWAIPGTHWCDPRLTQESVEVLADNDAATGADVLELCHLKGGVPCDLEDRVLDANDHALGRWKEGEGEVDVEGA